MYVTQKGSAFLLLLFDIIEEPIDIIMLLDELLSKSTEPVENTKTKHDDNNAEDVNHIHLTITYSSWRRVIIVC